MKTMIALALSSFALLTTANATAQELSGPSGSTSTPPAASPTASSTTATSTSRATTSSAAEAAPPTDGGRFRFGINPTIGLESVSASGTSISGTMYGLDLRLGYQINNLFAIYAQPHLSFGELGTTTGRVPITGFTGTFVGTVMAEATFLDRLFVGAGAGYGVLNNPSGIAIEGRFGGYPLMGRGPNGIRRKGLMIGGDVRAVFVDGATGTLLMGAIGYEAF